MTLSFGLSSKQIEWSCYLAGRQSQTATNLTMQGEGEREIQNFDLDILILNCLLNIQEKVSSKH